MDLMREFVSDHLVNILVIIMVAYLTKTFAMFLINRLVRKAVKRDKFKTEQEKVQKGDTLISILGTVILVGVWLIAGLITVSELGVDIAPLLAGAGILGVALGFGAQTIVKDFLAGFFIVAENHYRVGDVVQVNQGIAGVVERVTIRETVLRDLDGMVHHVPNGSIDIATNMTMGYAGINLDIGVSYDTDLDQAEKIINDVGRELSQDEDWSDNIINAPEFLRVDDFGESDIVIKIVGKTIPMKQWAVTGELRRRLKKAFDQNGIEIPFPQRTISYTKDAPKAKKGSAK